MKKIGSKREFDSEEAYADDQLAQPDKKRRLKADQVKSLERTFEVENKLTPDRKVQLAVELGLVPRQVAIWFQNRRARSKDKQLERDYVELHSAYDELKRSYEAAKRDNQILVQQIGDLKSGMVAMDAKEEKIGDEGAFGFSLKNYEAAFFNCDVNVDSAMSEVHSEDNGTLNGVMVSSYEIVGNEEDYSLAIWPPADSYSFLADEEETAPVFNWYCPDPWT